MKKKKVFIICPVRDVNEETKQKIASYVRELEDCGTIVHWPSRDTNQDDPVGYAICDQNRHAIFVADEVHIWYDASSQGSLFDAGMAFAFMYVKSKRVVIINREVVHETPHKSFQNVFLALEKAPS